MKDLIKLRPVEGDISEIRGREDLVGELKKRTSNSRLALLQRLNLEDIETPADLHSIIEVLAGDELRQFTKLLDGTFLSRILAIDHQLKDPPHYSRSASRMYQLITTANLVYFIPIFKQYSLDQIRTLLDALLDLTLRKMVITALSDLLTTKLKEYLTESHIKQPDWPLSFAKWSNDYLYSAKDWTDSDEDSYSDRCEEIIRRIHNALHILFLLEGAEQLNYLNTLFHLLNGITHNQHDLNYLLSSLPRDNKYRFMTLLIKRGITAQQIGLLSEHPDCRYAFIVALFITGHNSAANLKLIKAAIAVNLDSPEATLAHLLMSNTPISQDLLLRLKENRYQSEEDRVISGYLVAVVHAIRNNRPPSHMPMNIAPLRESVLSRFVDHLITTEDYKVTLSTLSKNLVLMSQEESVLSQARTCGFFNNPPRKNEQNLIEHSSFSDEHVREIQSQITTLQKEISSVWPFPNKDRKIEKIKGLKALLIMSTQMEACLALDQIEEEFPEIRKGSISTRTAALLDRIRNKQQYSDPMTLS